jgi:hypothetical protein
MEDEMVSPDSSDCADILLDLLCYELLLKMLSPEIEAMLLEHLEACPSCAAAARGYFESLKDQWPGPGLLERERRRN